MSLPSLPDYRRPPVDEIVAAVQFAPVVPFALPQMIALDRGLEGWRLVEAREALDPIVESGPGQPAVGRFGLAFGTPPQRAILVRDDADWQLQVQHDRVALNESRGRSRPSSKRVIPELGAQLAAITAALGQPDVRGCPATPEIVELVYVNTLSPERGFATWGRIGELLEGLRAPGRMRLTEPEALHAAWAFALFDGDVFAGRLRFEVGPSSAGGAQLQLISRRYVGGEDPLAVLERCHDDIVLGFDDITTESAHATWEKFQ